MQKHPISDITSRIRNKVELSPSTKRLIAWGNACASKLHSTPLRTRSVDEDFERLVDEMDFIERHCGLVGRAVEGYRARMMEVFGLCDSIARFHRTLFDEGLFEDPGGHEEPFLPQKRSTEYAKAIALARASVDALTAHFAGNIAKRMNVLLVYISRAKLRVRRRNSALRELDHVLEKLDVLAITKASGTLTTRETQKTYSLERRSKVLRGEFDAQNDLLKTEMPRFLELAHECVAATVAWVVCVDCHAYELIWRCLLLLGPEFSFTEEEVMLSFFHARLAGSLVLPPSPGLGITGYKQVGLRKELTAQTPSRFCRALYDFRPQEATDLSFKQGDIIRILNDEGTWWKGELDGAEGSFPSTYVEYAHWGNSMKQ